MNEDRGSFEEKWFIIRIKLVVKKIKWKRFVLFFFTFLFLFFFYLRKEICPKIASSHHRDNWCLINTQRSRVRRSQMSAHRHLIIHLGIDQLGNKRHTSTSVGSQVRDSPLAVAGHCVAVHLVGGPFERADARFGRCDACVLRNVDRHVDHHFAKRLWRFVANSNAQIDW